ncbi:hypothetical protein MYX07_00430 [Patescibacteria group bacterium AH-259-L07]|nr:hypothetical protein [Patescibacteria group bacterium AH-259-L07]
MMWGKKNLIIVISLLLLLSFINIQPANAGFFDWFSWSNIKSSVGQVFKKELSQIETSPKKSSYESSSESSSTKICEPEIIIKEVPVEKIVVKEIIKEVPKEIIKEIPVEKIVYKDNPGYQQCQKDLNFFKNEHLVILQDRNTCIDNVTEWQEAYETLAQNSYNKSDVDIKFEKAISEVLEDYVKALEAALAYKEMAESARLELTKLKLKLEYSVAPIDPSIYDYLDQLDRSISRSQMDTLNSKLEEINKTLQWIDNPLF